MAAPSSTSPKTNTMSFASSNLCLNTQMPETFDNQHILLQILERHPLHLALTHCADVPLTLIAEANRTASVDDGTTVLNFSLNGVQHGITSIEFGRILNLQPFVERAKNIPEEDLLATINDVMRHNPRISTISGFRKGKVSPLYQCLTQIVIKCLTGKTSGMDQLNRSWYAFLHGIITGAEVDFSEILWYEFVNQTKTHPGQVHMPRFWSVVIDFTMAQKRLTPPGGPLFQRKFLKYVQTKANIENLSYSCITAHLLNFLPSDSPLRAAYIMTVGQPLLVGSNPVSKPKSRKSAEEKQTVEHTDDREGPKVPPSDSAVLKSQAPKSSRPRPKVLVQSKISKRKKTHIATKPLFTTIPSSSSDDDTVSPSPPSPKRTRVQSPSQSNPSAFEEEDDPLKTLESTFDSRTNVQGPDGRPSMANILEAIRGHPDFSQEFSRMKTTPFLRVGGYESDISLQVMGKGTDDIPRTSFDDTYHKEDSAWQVDFRRQYEEAKFAAAQRNLLGGKDIMIDLDSSAPSTPQSPKVSPKHKRSSKKPLVIVRKLIKKNSAKIDRLESSITKLIKSVDSAQSSYATTSSVSALSESLKASQQTLMDHLKQHEDLISKSSSVKFEMADQFRNLVEDVSSWQSQQTDLVNELCRSHAQDVFALEELVTHVQAENVDLREQVVKLSKQVSSEFLSSLTSDLINKVASEVMTRFHASFVTVSSDQDDVAKTVSTSQQGGEPSSEPSNADSSPHISPEPEIVKITEETVGISGAKDDDSVDNLIWTSEEEEEVNDKDTSADLLEKARQVKAWDEFLQTHPNIDDIEDFGYVNGEIVRKETLDETEQISLIPMPAPTCGKVLRDSVFRPQKSYIFSADLAPEFQPDLPLDPNSIFFEIWTPSIKGLSLKDAQLELKARNFKFYKKFQQLRSNVWSNRSIIDVEKATMRKINSQPWFQLEVRRSDGNVYLISDADFPDLNPNDFYVIWEHTRLKERIDKKKYLAGVRALNFLKTYLWDMFRHDGQLGVKIAGENWLRLEPSVKFEGIEKRRCEVTRIPELGLIYRSEGQKYFIRASQLHMYPSKVLSDSIAAIEARQKGTEDDRKEFVQRINWWLIVRDWVNFVFTRLSNEGEI